MIVDIDSIVDIDFDSLKEGVLTRSDAVAHGVPWWSKQDQISILYDRLLDRKGLANRVFRLECETYHYLGRLVQIIPKKEDYISPFDGRAK